jgi:Arc/MetJ family transcription regulator
MRTTITIDAELLSNARELSGITETSALVRTALTALVQREAARALARLGGSAPDMVAPPRRRFEANE